MVIDNDSDSSDLYDASGEEGGPATEAALKVEDGDAVDESDDSDNEEEEEDGGDEAGDDTAKDSSDEEESESEWEGF